jgi:hypothetical protein
MASSIRGTMPAGSRSASKPLDVTSAPEKATSAPPVTRGAPRAIVATDDDDAASAAFRVAALPTCFVVDEAGLIARALLARRDERRLDAR